MKKKEDFINDALPEDFANERDYYAELKLEHYELRRQEKVKMCIEVITCSYRPIFIKHANNRNGIVSLTN